MGIKFCWLVFSERKGGGGKMVVGIWGFCCCLRWGESSQGRQGVIYLRSGGLADDVVKSESGEGGWSSSSRLGRSAFQAMGIYAGESKARASLRIWFSARQLNRRVRQ